MYIKLSMTAAALVVVLILNAQSPQTVRTDSVAKTVRVGYIGVNQNTQAGAVVKVTGEQMTKGLISSSLNALNGQTAGVQVTNSGNQEAMVSAVRVRGTTSLTGGNDPLVIIDGVISDLTTLSTIYPSDIESFTILKDASETAQYGSRGAAGVIDVATKKGKASKFHISYDGAVGVESIYKRLHMLNGNQFRQAAKSLSLSYIDFNENTDFVRSLERTGFKQHHHISFGGGSEQANYRASVSVMDHKTTVVNKNYRNYLAKLDISQKAFDNRLKVDLGILGSLQKKNLIPFQQKLIYSSQAFNPTFPEGKNGFGSYDQVTEAWWISNPYSLLDMKDNEDNAHVNVHLTATLDLGRDIKMHGFASYSYNTINNAHYYPTFVWSHGEAYRGNEKSESILGNISIEKKIKFRLSSLNLMFLAESEQQRSTGFFTTVSDFSTDAFGYDKLKAGATRPWGGTDSKFSDSHMESFLVHTQYTLLDKYTVTANVRADASSKVGENNRWGFFPSLSGAWVIGKEKWIKKYRFISNAKFRIGYGMSGNLGGIDPYMSKQLIQPNGIVSMGGAPVTTLGIVRNSNPDLRWEIKKTFNVGLDIAFWDNRIAITIDHYNSKTTDMLYVYDVPVPPFTFNQLLANLGSMKNSGLEIGFGITPLRTKDTELTINMNWSFERNKLLSLNGDYNGQYLTTPSVKGISSLYGAGFHGSSDVVFQVVGQQLGVFMLHHCKGIATDTDGSKYYDITEEKYICGQATPKATMGSNIAFRYKQWDVTMQMNGAFGHKIYNGTALTYMNMLSLPNYNVMEGAPEQNIQDQTISDYWLERGDYVNIDYLTLGWNVPVRAKYITSLRVSASVNNLATFTGYSGLTPMINSSVINESLGLDDKNTLPVFRTYTIGLSIKF